MKRRVEFTTKDGEQVEPVTVTIEGSDPVIINNLSQTIANHGMHASPKIVHVFQTDVLESESSNQ